ncbi:MAG: hypothetical protein K1X57_03640 [Gemmataceae bacterium]|nr:hypothetical protein [Gemmataceae bacterium]
MTYVILFLALVAFGLAIGLYFTGTWAQGWFYESVQDGMPVRAAIGAAALTVVLALWAFIESKAPGRFDSLFRFSAADSVSYEQFTSEKQADGRTVETVFHKRVVPPGRVEYVDAAGKPWRRSDSGVVTAIVVDEAGEKRRFVARLNPDGTFLRDPSDRNKTLEVEYVEDGGKRRVMTESDIGTIHSSRLGGFFVNLIFNLLLLAAWIATMAVALGFDWGRATILGLIGWVVMLLVIWPPLQDRVRATINARPEAAAWNPTRSLSANWCIVCCTPGSRTIPS